MHSECNKLVRFFFVACFFACPSTILHRINWWYNWWYIRGYTPRCGICLCDVLLFSVTLSSFGVLVQNNCIHVSNVMLTIGFIILKSFLQWLIRSLIKSASFLTNFTNLLKDILNDRSSWTWQHHFTTE